MLRLYQDSEGREKKVILQINQFHNPVQSTGHAYLSSFASSERVKCGLSNYACSLANKPRTAMLFKCNRNSGSVFIFVTAKCVPITHHYHSRLNHQHIEIQAYYYYVFLRPYINSVTSLRRALTEFRNKTIHCSHCSS